MGERFSRFSPSQLVNHIPKNCIEYMVQCKFLDPAGEQLIQNLYGRSEKSMFLIYKYTMWFSCSWNLKTLISGVVSEGQSTAGVWGTQNSSKDGDSHSLRQKHENVTVEAMDWNWRTGKQALEIQVYRGWNQGVHILSNLLQRLRLVIVHGHSWTCNNITFIIQILDFFLNKVLR